MCVMIRKFSRLTCTVSSLYMVWYYRSTSLFICIFFFFFDTATTEIYTSDTLFPYTTLFRSERISPEELVELPGIKSVPVETWQLSSRSLLTRDADGHYKFTHRSILEFFFIKAFIEGEQRCLSMTWTSMMRDLFLSWGLSERADDKLALQLLSADIRATSLFPIAERHRPSAKLDANWVETIFSTRASVGARTTFPNSWRSAVAHVIRRDAMARAYDIADGLVWQVDLTNDIPERGDRHIYQHHRYSLSGTDDKAREWAVVDL